MSWKSGDEGAVLAVIGDGDDICDVIMAEADAGRGGTASGEDALKNMAFPVVVLCCWSW